MQLNPTLFFSGNAEEALDFYRAALGGALNIMRCKDAPGTTPSDPACGDKVLYGTLESPYGTLSAMDAPPDRAGEPGSNFGISVSGDDENATAQVFETLSNGGQVLMPYEQTFFAKKFGMTIDRFGIRWLISYSPVALSADARS